MEAAKAKVEAEKMADAAVAAAAADIATTTGEEEKA